MYEIKPPTDMEWVSKVDADNNWYLTPSANLSDEDRQDDQWIGFSRFTHAKVYVIGELARRLTISGDETLIDVIQSIYEMRKSDFMGDEPESSLTVKQREWLKRVERLKSTSGEVTCD